MASLFFKCVAMIGAGELKDAGCEVQLFSFSCIGLALLAQDGSWANAMTTMRLVGSALGVILVAFGPSYARAATVTYTVTGAVLHVAPDLQGQFSVGQATTYTFTLDTGIPDTNPSPFGGLFVNGLTSSSGSIGSYLFSTGAGNLVITFASSDVLQTNALTVTGPAVGVDTLYEVIVFFNDTTGTALSSDAFPLSLDISAFNQTKLDLFFLGPDRTIQEVIAPITGLESTFTSQTPIPAALPLFATGLGALGLLGWRRKRKDKFR